MFHAVQMPNGWLQRTGNGYTLNADEPTEFDTTLEALQALHDAILGTGIHPVFKIVPVPSIKHTNRKEYHHATERSKTGIPRCVGY